MLLVVQLGNALIRVSPTTEGGTISHQTNFFVALASHITPPDLRPNSARAETKTRDLEQVSHFRGVAESASTAAKSDTWSEIARTSEGSLSLPCQSQYQAVQTPQVPSNENVEVEYLCDLSEYFEYEQNAKAKSVKSMLKKKLVFWKSQLKASSLILNVIKHGYVIPFDEFPPRIYLKNNRSSILHADFVSGAILDLLGNGCIKEVFEPSFVVNPLTVSVNAKGKTRLVLDLRHVNQFVEKQKVKFEGVKEGLEYARQKQYMIKFDLRSGYHHIDIHSEFQKYLGFSWEIEGKRRYFEFTVLPFGLSSAGHIFTKVVRVSVKYWRSFGVPIVVYLDDGWVCADYNSCLDIAKLLQNTLDN